MLRHADPDRDAAACAAIYAPFISGTAVSFEEEIPDVAEMARRIADYGGRYAWLVAEVPDGIAGFAYASPHRARKAYRWSTEVSVYLDRRHHRQGIGRALYAALFDLLRRQRLRTALAGITLPNEASVALHRSFGFELVGVFRDIGWKEGSWHDVAWWQLQLDPLGETPPSEPLGPQRLEAGRQGPGPASGARGAAEPVVPPARSPRNLLQNVPPEPA